jgi:hypothetical protein
MELFMESGRSNHEKEGKLRADDENQLADMVKKINDIIDEIDLKDSSDAQQIQFLEKVKTIKSLLEKQNQLDILETFFMFTFTYYKLLPDAIVIFQQIKDNQQLFQWAALTSERCRQAKFRNSNQPLIHLFAQLTDDLTLDQNSQKDITTLKAMLLDSLKMGLASTVQLWDELGEAKDNPKQLYYLYKELSGEKSYIRMANDLTDFIYNELPHLKEPPKNPQDRFNDAIDHFLNYDMHAMILGKSKRGGISNYLFLGELKENLGKDFMEDKIQEQIIEQILSHIIGKMVSWEEALTFNKKTQQKENSIKVIKENFCIFMQECKTDRLKSIINMDKLKDNIKKSSKIEETIENIVELEDLKNDAKFSSLSLLSLPPKQPLLSPSSSNSSSFYSPADSLSSFSPDSLPSPSLFPPKLSHSLSDLESSSLSDQEEKKDIDSIAEKIVLELEKMINEIKNGEHNPHKKKLIENAFKICCKRIKEHTTKEKITIELNTLKNKCQEINFPSIIPHIDAAWKQALEEQTLPSMRKAL